MGENRSLSKTTIHSVSVSTFCIETYHWARTGLYQRQLYTVCRCLCSVLEDLPLCENRSLSKTIIYSVSMSTFCIERLTIGREQVSNKDSYTQCVGVYILYRNTYHCSRIGLYQRQ